MARQEGRSIAGGRVVYRGRPAKEAEAAWRGCIKIDLLHPSDPSAISLAHQKLIELYVTEDRLDDARDVIWDALEQAPKDDHPVILGMLARLELERVSPATRMVELLGYVKADPKNLEARRALAKAAETVGQESLADEQIQLCFKQAPNDLGVWRDYLQILQTRGDREVLWAAVQKLPKGHEGDAFIMYAKGVALEKHGSLQEAELAYAAAAKLRMREPEFVYRLAMVEQRLGKIQQAEQHRSQSNQMRQAYGRLADAYQQFAKASVAQPPDPEAIYKTVDEIAEIFHLMRMDRTADAWLKLRPRRKLVE